MFTLRPQVDIAGARPDFVLTWDGSDVEGIAVYTDGRTFHATSGNNRVADDAIKRMRLRRHGYIPLAVTHADLDEHAQRGESGTGASLPPLIGDRTVGLWAQQSSRHADLSRLLTDDPLQLIVDVVRSGSTAQLRVPGTPVTPTLRHPRRRYLAHLCDGSRRGIRRARSPRWSHHTVPHRRFDPRRGAAAWGSSPLSRCSSPHPADSSSYSTTDRPLSPSSTFPDAWRAWRRPARPGTRSA